MVGSPAVAGLIANAAFWLLIVLGWTELGGRRAAGFIAVWLIGYAGSGWVPQGAAWFIALVAVLDIALVFIVYRGDVHLT